MSDAYHEYEDRLLIEEHELHPERFRTMKQRFQAHIDSISSVTLRDCCRRILDDSRFLTWPASLSFHHAYEGGLLAHTVEVTDYALGSAIPGTDMNVLIAAALWHDFEKIREYELNELGVNFVGSGAMIDTPDVKALWSYTDYGKRIHHVQGSAIAFTLEATESGVRHEVIDAVVHCILAHHGRREWGSPVEPQTLEALLLHQADLISAKYGKTK